MDVEGFCDGVGDVNLRDEHAGLFGHLGVAVGCFGDEGAEVESDFADTCTVYGCRGDGMAILFEEGRCDTDGAWVSVGGRLQRMEADAVGDWNERGGDWTLLRRRLGNRDNAFNTERSSSPTNRRNVQGLQVAMAINHLKATFQFFRFRLLVKRADVVVSTGRETSS